jgi:Uma2 family endonuclease
MGMPASYPPVTTIEALLALPDDGLRHELLDGVHVVTPAPRYLHQRALSELAALLRSAIGGREGLEVLHSPADILLGTKSLVQPDLFVIPRATGVKIERWADVGVPLIVVEVLSEATAASDRGAKRRIYQRAGVSECWIVDLDARLIERWRPDDVRPEILDALLEWPLPDGAQGQLDVRRFFEIVWEDAT